MTTMMLMLKIWKCLWMMVAVILFIVLSISSCAIHVVAEKDSRNPNEQQRQRQQQQLQKCHPEQWQQLMTTMNNSNNTHYFPWHVNKNQRALKLLESGRPYQTTICLEQELPNQIQRKQSKPYNVIIQQIKAPIHMVWDTILDFNQYAKHELHTYESRIINHHAHLYPSKNKDSHHDTRFNTSSSFISRFRIGIGHVVETMILYHDYHPSLGTLTWCRIPPNTTTPSETLTTINKHSSWNHDIRLISSNLDVEDDNDTHEHVNDWYYTYCGYMHLVVPQPISTTQNTSNMKNHPSTLSFNDTPTTRIYYTVQMNVVKNTTRNMKNNKNSNQNKKQIQSIARYLSSPKTWKQTIQWIKQLSENKFQQQQQQHVMNENDEQSKQQQHQKHEPKEESPLFQQQQQMPQTRLIHRNHDFENIENNSSDNNKCNNNMTLEYLNHHDNKDNDRILKEEWHVKTGQTDVQFILSKGNDYNEGDSFDKEEWRGKDAVRATSQSIPDNNENFNDSIDKNECQESPGKTAMQSNPSVDGNDEYIIMDERLEPTIQLIPTQNDNEGIDNEDGLDNTVETTMLFISNHDGAVEGSIYMDDWQESDVGIMFMSRSISSHYTMQSIPSDDDSDEDSIHKEDWRDDAIGTNLQSISSLDDNHERVDEDECQGNAVEDTTSESTKTYQEYDNSNVRKEESHELTVGRTKLNREEIDGIIFKEEMEDIYGEKTMESIFSHDDNQASIDEDERQENAIGTTSESIQFHNDNGNDILYKEECRDDTDEKDIIDKETAQEHTVGTKIQSIPSHDDNHILDKKECQGTTGEATRQSIPNDEDIIEKRHRQENAFGIMSQFSQFIPIHNNTDSFEKEECLENTGDTTSQSLPRSLWCSTEVDHTDQAIVSMEKIINAMTIRDELIAIPSHDDHELLQEHVGIARYTMVLSFLILLVYNIYLYFTL